MGLGLAEAQQQFRADLLTAGHLVATSSPGLYGRSGTFERIIVGIERMVTEAGADQRADVVRFPAVFPREVFERTDYIVSFPDLTGAIHIFDGDTHAHEVLLAKRSAGEEWSGELTPSDLMLVSAACHPAYPMLAGTLPEGGRRLDVLGFCFRHEPSIDPARMQAFRQREYVYVGESDNAVEHRETWVGRGLALLHELGLDARPVVANDPFFGRAGRILSVNQREEKLKIELVVNLYADSSAVGSGTALVSANCHLDHFGKPFGIHTSTGETAHSACVGFGLERIALALLRTHGMDVDTWPDAVRARLWP